MPRPPFDGFDLSAFWRDADYYRKEYVEPPPTPGMIAAVEAELGYRLPASYVALMRSQNGGAPVNVCFPTRQPTSWSENHVAITAFKGIGFKRQWSLCGSLGSRFKIDQWDYPDLGVYFGDCPSAGHDMIALDYRACGPEGEPTVVHVDQEFDYRITPLAPDFESFVRGLVNDAEFEADLDDDDLDDDKRESLQRVRGAPFSPPLQRLCEQWPDKRMPAAIRRAAEAIVEANDSFSLLDDDRSQQLYAAQFLLLSNAQPLRSEADFIERYPALIASPDDDDAFSADGWGISCVKNWFQARVAVGDLVWNGEDWRFSDAFREALLRDLFAD